MAALAEQVESYAISTLFFGFFPGELSEYVKRRLTFFDDGSFLHVVFVLFHNLPSYLAMMLFALGFTKIRDIYLVVLWLAAVICNLEAQLLARYVVRINQDGYVGVLNYDTPSYVTQIAFFYATVFFTFPLAFRRYGDWWQPFWLVQLPLLVPAAQVGLRFNSLGAVWFGAALGTLNAVVFQVCMVTWIYPRGRGWAAAVQAAIGDGPDPGAQSVVAALWTLVYTPDNFSYPEGAWILVDEVRGRKLGPDHVYEPHHTRTDKLEVAEEDEWGAWLRRAE